VRTTRGTVGGVVIHFPEQRVEVGREIFERRVGLAQKA